jgi:4-amino-4-deoxy-L-arabinose transferase-like glycosyltransferase
VPPGRCHLPAVLPFLLVLLGLEVSSMTRLSPTHDEGTHLAFGRNVLQRSAVGPAGQAMAVSLVNDLPLRGLRAAGIMVSHRTRFFLARLPTVLVSLGLGVLVFVWADRLYGLRGALLAAALYTACPTVIAHSRLITTDIMCACLMFASTLLFVRYLGAPTLPRLALVATVTGLAQISKQTALLLVPIFVALWLVDAARARRWPRPAGRLLAHGLVAVVIVLVVVNAGYLFRGTLMPVRAYLAEYRALAPDVRDEPAMVRIASVASLAPEVRVPLPYNYVAGLVNGVFYNAAGSGHGPNYLLGELSRQGWWYYFFVAFALKTPLATIVLLAAAVALSPRWLRRDPVEESALLLVPAVTLAFVSFVSTAQLGIRYLLPAFPFLFVAAGKLAAYTPRRYAVAYRAGLVVLVLWAAASSLSFHPHYLSYFNELIGDRKTMYRYLADSNVDWGQSQQYLARYLATVGPEPVAVNPDSPVSGRVVVNVNRLVGVTGPREKYAWLRDRFEPVGHVAYSWLVYEVPER